MKKQLSLFLGLFLFLSLSIHFKEWFSHPVDHLLALPQASAYGLGMVHPLVFTLIFYIILVLFLALVNMIKRIFSK